MSMHSGAKTRTNSKQNEKVQDRRTLPRMLLDHPVVCFFQGKTLDARVKSLSGEGILLETNYCIDPGSLLEIRIGPPLTMNRLFRAEMQVLRAEEPCSPGGNQRFAGKFVRVLDPD